MLNNCLIIYYMFFTDYAIFKVIFAIWGIIGINLIFMGTFNFVALSCICYSI